MSLKNTKKSIPLVKLVSSDAMNARLSDNYDLDSLRPQILAKGKIINPLVVEPIKDTDTYLVLQGNRRTRCALLMVADPATPDDIRAALEKIDCLVYSDLSEEERDVFIFDHGETRPLNREETVLSVWRLMKQFKREKEIGERLYYQLARYSGNERKLNSLPSDPVARSKYLTTWFRGTLGQYIMSAGYMGDRVREAMLFTARKEDGRLKEGETVPFNASRDRIVELSKARTVDEKAAGWDAEAGGETFNKLIAKYQDEDAGKATRAKKDKRPNKKDLENNIGLFKSSALKAAFSVAAGNDEAGQALLTMDETIHRGTIVSDILCKAIPDVKDEHVKALLMALVGSGPAADVELALQPFVG